MLEELLWMCVWIHVEWKSILHSVTRPLELGLYSTVQPQHNPNPQETDLGMCLFGWEGKKLGSDVQYTNTTHYDHNHKQSRIQHRVFDWIAEISQKH